MRKVIYSERVMTEDTGLEDMAPMVEQGEALFHQWGLGVFKYSGPNVSTAIIELEDGTVRNVPAEQIRFISGELDIKLKE